MKYHNSILLVFSALCCTASVFAQPALATDRAFAAEASTASTTDSNASQVKVSVVDAEDTGSVTTGAKMNIYKKDGANETLITSIGEKGDLVAGTTVMGLEAGDYVLKEKAGTTPQGYQKAADVPFTVTSDRKTYDVSMSSERTVGYVNIYVTGGEAGNMLSGCSYALKGQDGSTLSTMTTDSTGKAATSNVPIGTYADGVYTGASEYTLIETAAPEGYDLDTSPYTIKFDYLDDSTPVVSIDANLVQPVSAAAQLTSATNTEVPIPTATPAPDAAAAQPEAETTETTMPVQTSDPGDAYVYGAIFLFGASGLCRSLAEKKREDRVMV